ncbi:hypothetical protein C8Q80DRAFT_1114281 [Daedaleopsis nitida]|nr:hypothetical protein C8Q80DRAFT_1114281 [Daedaleopsis nitida]
MDWTRGDRGTRFEKRFDNARFTVFTTGVDACGGFDHDDDFIVAIGKQQWDGGSHCYAPITITYQGKTANAKITDECGDCPYGAIDLSPSLFVHLVPGGIQEGEVYGSWNFVGANDPKPELEPKTTTLATPEKPKTTSHTNTTHEAQPATTSHSTTTKPSTATKSSVSSTSAFMTSTPSSTAPTATITSFDSGNLNQFSMAMVQLAELMLAAADSNSA